MVKSKIMMNLKKNMRQLNQWVGDYLTFNRMEQRGILVLSLVLLGVIIVDAVIPAETFQTRPDFRTFSAEIAAFEKAWHRAADSDSIARLHRYTGYRRYGDKYPDKGFPMPVKPKPLLIVDLNTADTFELQQLRGIGPAFARRIVNYRDRLRGFSESRQLLEVFGMDTARYASIEANLKVTRDSIHPMDINTVTFKELLRHPYFPFAITKNIMVYRQKCKAFKSLDELKNIQGVNDSLLSRMIIYLRVGP